MIETLPPPLPKRPFTPPAVLLEAAQRILSSLPHVVELRNAPKDWPSQSALFSSGDPDPLETLASSVTLSFADLQDHLFDAFGAPCIILQHTNLQMDAVNSFLRYGTAGPGYYGWVPICRYGPLLVVVHFLPSCEDFGNFPRDLTVRLTVRADAYMELRDQFLTFVHNTASLERLMVEGSRFVPFEEFRAGCIAEYGDAKIPEDEMADRLLLRWLCLVGVGTEGDVSEIRSALDRPTLDSSFFPNRFEAALAFLKGPNPLIPLELVSPDPDAYALVPDTLRASQHCIAFFQSRSRLYVAIPSHYGADVEDQLAQRITTLLPVRFLADAQESIALQDILDRDTSPNESDETEEASQALTSLEHYIAPRTFTGYDPYMKGEPAKTLFQYILFSAARRQASDIHFEYYKGRCRIRLTVHGNGVTLCTFPIDALARFSRIIKLAVAVDVSLLGPVEGHFTFAIANRRIDVRVEMMPIVCDSGVPEYKSVLRLFDKGLGIKTLSHIELPSEDVAIIQKGYMKPQGMFLVTGPTGSGKSTTLYAIINGLNNDRNYIYTAEDPVEQMIPGVSQIEIDPDAKPGEPMSFPDVLKRLLRMAPTHILVGEMRDPDTAQTAINAALTGHFVMATLHTNDALGVIPRLINLGIPHELISQTLSMALAQRLVRTLCVCKSPQTLTQDHRDYFEAEGVSIPQGVTRIFRPSGCPVCGHTGYRGRSAVVEIFAPNDPIRIAIAERDSLHNIRSLAIENGYVPLRVKGLDLVFSGKSSLEEVAYKCSI
jgi:type II secretory ATPase GspE/PulE/Tfp pilus assembly ATPase PilB-like protein